MPPLASGRPNGRPILTGGGRFCVAILAVALCISLCWLFTTISNLVSRNTPLFRPFLGIQRSVVCAFKKGGMFETVELKGGTRNAAVNNVFSLNNNDEQHRRCTALHTTETSHISACTAQALRHNPRQRTCFFFSFQKTTCSQYRQFN
jgi:hypothetical protein